MTTLSEIKSRCVEEGDCWIWQGQIESGGSPRMWDAKRNTHASVRKVVLNLRGKEIEAGYRPLCTCGTRGCVAPNHLRVVSLSKYARKVLLPVANTQLRKAKIAATWRKRHARLTYEDVCGLRMGDEPSAQAAKRLGVSVGLVNKVRAHTAWRDHTASPWAGLMR